MKVPAGVAAPSRLPVVDLVRTISITIVILGHSIRMAGTVSGPLAWMFGLLAPNATYGVTMFFVVSGFVITYTVAQNYPSLDRVSFTDFYHRRIARLLPLACVVLVGGVVVAVLTQRDSAWSYVFWNPTARFTPWFVLAFPFFFYNWARIAYSNSFVGWGLQWDIFWSLAIEEQFYLVYPFILKKFGGQRRQLARFLVGVIIFGFLYSAVTAVVAPQDFWLGFGGSPAGFESIAFGALAWLAVDSRFVQRLTANARFMIGMFASLGAILVVLGPPLAYYPVVRVYGPTILAFCVAAFLVVTVKSPNSHRIPKVLTHPGRLSYGLYLLHPILIFALWELFGGRHPALFIAAVLLGAVIVATASARLFEVPFNKRLRVILPQATQALKSIVKRRLYTRRPGAA